LEVGGVVAGASFALSPFMLSWTALSSVITTVAWIPWALWAVVSFPSPRLRGEGAGGEGSALVRTVCLALAGGMMLLGGHLQFAAYGIGAVVLLTLFNISSLKVNACIRRTHRRSSNSPRPQALRRFASPQHTERGRLRGVYRQRDQAVRVRQPRDP
jgi:hypothetical protein